MASGGMSGGSGPEPVVQQIAFLSALIAIWACWPLVRMQIPADAQFAFADLVREHWVHRDALQPWLDRRWAWLAMHAYHLWFALATLPGCIAVAVVRSEEHTSELQSLMRISYAVFCMKKKKKNNITTSRKSK